VRSSYVVQLVVEAAGVAHGLAVVVPPPQRRVGGAAVGAGDAHAPVAVRRLPNILLIRQNRCITRGTPQATTYL
jgi:hypothetical protein